MKSRNFFSNENIDPYRNDPKINSAIHNAGLLNYSEFMDWYSQPNVRTSRRILSKRNLESDNEEVHKMHKDSLKQIANEVCEKKIDAQYGISSILNLNFEKFDILVAVAPDYDTLKKKESDITTKTALKNKTKHILGFIIVEKGECKMLPDFYTVNLICARSKVEYKKYGKHASLKRERIRGAILLGAYLFCAKRINQTMGLLELADGYKNISGFFSYSKMGFVKDLSLFDRKCFKDYANLPMSLNINDYSYEQIINYASGLDKIRDINDDTGLIYLVPKTPRQQALQVQISGLCNLTYQIDYILNGSYALDVKLDKNEIKFLQELEDYYIDQDPHYDFNTDDYLNYIYDSMDNLIEEFKSASKSRTRSSSRSKMSAGSTKKRFYAYAQTCM